ncbi:uncharacterized protein K02A2.6-like [Mizuhopecten yessoensis]|uniref:uncharacterized protein K02A2.6-like n=1 Tax=Mizuhopecten yessoensis TaxID=6573 RepID=UPI000B45EEB2|nr:uncharacterized protein K02A2.6-like [Mizuhopecten yessoensis]
MSATPFDQPRLDWGAGDQYQEFLRFRQHVAFCFKGPLARAENADKAGWIGMWIGQEDLKLLAMDCEYTDSNNVLIDLIIAGVKHKKVQERLLDQGQDITLTKAIQIGQQYELSQAQVKMMRGEEILKLNCTKQHKKPASKIKKPVSPNLKPSQTPKTYQSNNYRNKSNSGNICGSCGFTHDSGKCPAKGSTCNYCKGQDHWKKMCRKRLRNKVHSIQSDEYETDDDELLTINTTTVTDVSVIDDKWVTTLNINGEDVKFRIDTGARVSMLTKNQIDNMSGNRHIKDSHRTLKSFSNHRIKPVGSVILPVKYCSRKDEINFEIVDIDQENIISGDSTVLLGLLQVPPDNSLSTDPVLVLSSTPAEDELTRDFPDLVKTTGTLPGEYSLSIDKSAEGVIHPVRKLPAAIKPKAIEKLREMEGNGYITRVDRPTEWVSSMVVSVKGDKIRICIDPRDLNRAIQREHHPMKTIEEVITDIPDAKIFSVLDAKSGFLQIQLDEASSYLTTFNTPIGRYRWLRLPFGIKSAPEIYQKIMDNMIAGIDGAFAIIDDILIAGRDAKDHDRILRQVVERATSYNLKLNFQKCKIRQRSVPYMGHVITDCGLKPDLEKVRAIIGMPTPKDKEGIRRFLGLVQYLSKFVPNLSQVDAPLRVLLKSDTEFQWNHEQNESFIKLKQICSEPPVLAFYNVRKPVEIECDASKDGLGAVLIQEGRVVAYASRSLTETEKRYAQIEKEMLSIVYSCSKFHSYIFGKEVTVYSDHKPLETLFRKTLLSAPMRIQRMMIRLQWYDLSVVYRKGKEMHVSDALSRAFLPPRVIEEEEEKSEIISMISVSASKYTEIQSATRSELQILMDTIHKGWPDSKNEVYIEAKPYWDSRDQLSVLDSIVYKGSRIVIPPSMRKEMLSLIHKSHLGIAKCKSRAREVMYWPCMNADIEDTVSNCSLCAEHQKLQGAEPLRPTPTPDLPYSHVGCDIFEFESRKYLLLVDYYSKYIDAVKLVSETTTSVIEVMKSVFACHGLPRKLRSDNGPQFTSAEFKKFCQTNEIIHETSSPHFQSSNGEAERAIQTVKQLWRKADDKEFALLDYRTTPLEGINLSPSQLLMNRRPRNALPASENILKPSTYDSKKVKQHMDAQKAKQKVFYDQRRGVKELSPLEDGTEIRMKTPGTKALTPGTVVQKSDKPRSYIVRSNESGRLFRRNRKHLRKSTETANYTQGRWQGDEMEDMSSSPNTELQTDMSTSVGNEGNSSSPTVPNPVVTRSGRIVNPPKRLDL